MTKINLQNLVLTHATAIAADFVANQTRQGLGLKGQRPLPAAMSLGHRSMSSVPTADPYSPDCDCEVAVGERAGRSAALVSSASFRVTRSTVSKRRFGNRIPQATHARLALAWRGERLTRSVRGLT